MTGCTRDGNTIPVVAPKDAEGRRVPLDTEAMYDDNGVKYDVCGLIFRSMTEICDAGWTVELTTAENKVRQISLNCMYLEKPDSLKQLAEDLNRVRARHDEHCGDNDYSCNPYDGAPCVYVKRETDSCTACRFFYETDTCLDQMIGDIIHRVNRLAGDNE